MPSRLKKSEILPLITLLIALCVTFLIVDAIIFYFKRVYTKNLEHFEESSDYKSSLKYYKNLNVRLDKIEKIIDNNVKTVEKMESKFDDFKSDICYILSDVNNSLKGNYISNVPEEEYKLDKQEQVNRKAKREAKSSAYMKDIQDLFIKRYYLSIFQASPEYKQFISTIPNKEFTENIENQIQAKIDGEVASGKRPPPPSILECFSSISDDENADLEQHRDDLNERISDISKSLSDLKNNFSSLKGTYGDKTIPSYNLTLAYNEKYISKLISEMGKKLEGFEDVPRQNPADLINKLEKDCDAITNDIANINAIVLLMEKNIANQMLSLKKSKRIVNDTEYQNSKMEKASKTVEISR
jgi:hypothetical protein